MRKSSKRFGLVAALAAVAALAVMAVGATAASAANPEYYHCKFQGPGGGSYSVYACPTASYVGPGNGEWERVPVEPGEDIAFESEGGKKFLRTHVTFLKLKATIECTASTDSGTITGPRSSTDRIKFTGCKETEPLTATCHSTSPVGEAEEIITKLLTDKPVWLNEAEGIVGIALNGEGAGAVEAEFECGTNKITVTGSVLGEVVSPLNEMRANGELAFQCEPAGSSTQKWTSYEEPPGTSVEDRLVSSLNGEKAEASCEEEETNDTITFEEPVEIKT